MVGVMVAVGVPALGQERPPNIVLIMADDLGYGHLGSYGQTKIETPNLDRMAAEGIRFTQAYAGSTVCAPSRSVLMSGLHAGHAPVRGNWGGMPLREADVTLAEVLRGAGYTTGMYGKWGLGEYGTTGVPNRQGFDDFAGFLHQIHAHFYYPEYLWKNDTRWPLPGNDVGGRIVGEAGGRTHAGDADGRRTQYAPDELLEHALHFVRANRDRPFFLYLPTIIPHVEVIAPPASVEPYLGRFEEEPCSDPRAGYAGTDHPKATYAAMITHLDRNVGRILDLLDELGLDDNTLVVFTSDNGAQSGYCANPEFFEATGSLRGYKRDLYEGGLRVPLVARWPGRIAPGQVSDHLTYFPDFMPTFAELAGAPVPPWTDGLSLVPTLLGETSSRTQAEHAYLYWEFAPRGEVDGPDLMQAVRVGDWKAVRARVDAPVELYHLTDDVGETTDLAARHPDRAARMAALMTTARTPARPHLEPIRVQGRSFR